jgi:hypothetical protein
MVSKQPCYFKLYVTEVRMSPVKRPILFKIYDLATYDSRSMIEGFVWNEACEAIKSDNNFSRHIWSKMREKSS